MMFNLQENNRAIWNCKACPLRDSCREALGGRIINPSWESPKLMIVCDRPSYEEDFLVTQFSDRHSIYLMKSIEEVYSGPYYLTYATKCFNQLTFAQFKKQGTVCVDTWLKREVEQLKPKVVLCMGEHSHYALIKQEFKTKSHKIDKTVSYLKDGTKYTSYYSPFYLFNGNKFKTTKFQWFLKSLVKEMEQ